MKGIAERGIGACMDEALALASAGTAGYHLPYDLDGIDPMEAQGVGTPVPGGPDMPGSALDL
jgi:arginase